MRSKLPAPAAAIAAACLATSLTTAPVLAQDEEELTWYVVEVIVFERTSEIGRNAEAWPEDPGLPALADALELSVEGVPLEALERGAGEVEQEPAPATETATTEALEADDADPNGVMPRAFQLVPPEEFRLTDAWKSLEKSSACRPMLQVAWIQPGFPAEDARLVHVRNANGALGTVSRSAEAGGDETGGIDGGDVAGGDGTLLASGVEMARDPSLVALDGTLRVHRARYLHVQADLLYYRPMDGDARAPVPPDDDPNALPAQDSPDTAYIEQLLAEEDTAPRVFRLTESRRMRSRELHYLDHPLFGVLVEAWPLELPEPPPAAEAGPEDDATGEPTGAGQTATEG